MNAHFSPGATQHDRWLMEEVVAAVQCGAATLLEVVTAAKGADPAAVLETIRCAIRSGRLNEEAEGLAESRCADAGDGVFEPALPMPHPLDFDWRFSRLGAAYLLERLSALAKNDLCMVASTTVALLAARRQWRGRVNALDTNSRLLSVAKQLQPQLQTYQVDVTREALPLVQASAVIADPPWYKECMQCFLWASARLCEPGGYVFLTAPSEGTRPGASADRDFLLRRSCLFGLKPVAIERHCVAYETPLFEWNALRAAGIKGSIGCWRRGDLIVLQRDLANGPHAARPERLVDPQVWAEVAIGETRIRFRERLRTRCDPQLCSIVPRDVLPTVSRRDRRRRRADVWTTGNRVYACQAPDVLRTIVEAVAYNRDVGERVTALVGRKLSAVEQRLVSKALSQVTGLIASERDDQAAYARDIAESPSRAA